MHWKVKAAAFKALDVLPLGQHLHFLMQRYVTKTWPRRPTTIAALTDTAQKTLSDFREFSAKPAEDAIFLEIGAGRDLIVPIALRLMGVGRVITADIRRLAKLEMVNQSADVVGKILNEPVPIFTSWSELNAFGIEYRAPFDVAAEACRLPAIDAFISNEVLEHIPPPDLKAILVRVGRAMTKGAVTVHSIDYSDHFARDGGVSRYNFLQFSDQQWARYSSTFQYVNRLRHSEYLAILAGAGFNLVRGSPYSEEIPTHIAESITSQFRSFDPDDLRIMRSRVVAVKD